MSVHTGRGGTPCPRQDWLLPVQGRAWGTTPPPRPGLGTPSARTGVHPQPVMESPQTKQQSEHLLRGGRYASCGHAGELSCFCALFCCVVFCASRNWSRNTSIDNLYFIWRTVLITTNGSCFRSRNTGACKFEVHLTWER